MVSVEVVVETPLLEHRPLWRVADLPAFSWLRLWGGTTADEMGLIAWHLAKYNIDEFDGVGQCDDLLQRLIEEPEVTLPGGLRFQDEEGKVVRPGCCCGLEGWREWERFILEGRAPWLGHDPWPWVEKLDETIRVWAHQGSEVFLDIERNDFISKLRTAQSDLVDFLGNLEKWVDEIAPRLTRPLTEKFDRCFSVRSDLEILSSKNDCYSLA